MAVLPPVGAPPQAVVSPRHASRPRWRPSRAGGAAAGATTAGAATANGGGQSHGGAGAHSGVGGGAGGEPAPASPPPRLPTLPPPPPPPPPPHAAPVCGRAAVLWRRQQRPAGALHLGKPVGSAPAASTPLPVDAWVARGKKRDKRKPPSLGVRTAQGVEGGGRGRGAGGKSGEKNARRALPTSNPPPPPISPAGKGGRRRPGGGRS